MAKLEEIGVRFMKFMLVILGLGLSLSNVALGKCQVGSDGKVPAELVILHGKNESGFLFVLVNGIAAYDGAANVSNWEGSAYFDLLQIKLEPRSNGENRIDYSVFNKYGYQVFLRACGGEAEIGNLDSDSTIGFQHVRTKTFKLIE